MSADERGENLIGGDEQRVENRAAELRARIIAADHAYYALDNPLISDAEYDALMRELRALEEAYPALITPESPTQRVSGEATTGFVKVRHLTGMLSLANVRTPDALRAWQQRAQRLLPNATFSYVCEPKIDGLSMNLTYEHGRLITGVTRGDGTIGEDVTANVRTIGDIPHQMHRFDAISIPDRIEIRGEIYMRREDFEALNERLAAEAEQAGTTPRLFANARNGAAGSLRQKDASITASRPLSFLAYQIGQIEGAPEPRTQVEVLEWLRAWGFLVSPRAKHVATLEEAQAYCDQTAAERFSVGYDIDGAVIKINERWQQQELGAVNRDPKWAIAYKFAPVEGNTRLRDIVVTVGRTGKMTPNARLEPIPLGGVTVSRAQLFNEDEIRRKNLMIGDMVVVQRHGDVIPGIVKSLVELRDGSEKPWTFPKQCPVCGSPVFRAEGEADNYCTNTDCPEQRTERVIHFSAVMDIRGLGDAVAERLVEQNLIKDVADLYTLSEEQMLTLPGFQHKSATNLLKSIAATRSRTFAQVLSAIGIRYVGQKAAETLAEGLRSMDALLNAKQEEIAALPGIGNKIAESVYNWAQLPTNREFAERLKSAGLTLTAPEVDATDGGDAAHRPFAGETFLLTGSLEHLTRGQAEQAIAALGGKIANGVSKSLSHLIVGESAGSKLAKAEKLGVPIHDEAWLVDRLREYDAMPDERRRTS
jgi:DNA ligase (NAD+)